MDVKDSSRGGEDPLWVNGGVRAVIGKYDADDLPFSMYHLYIQ